ncbi:selenium-binding protein SBP56-related protein [Mycolicibacterium smegmatis]|uniref:Methanethiol oxidase n=2 Tax=Mycolicibacterium smegmatis (strain ATCC 700084 / mc(2)155) TaxID=246196 RepID=A0QU65_MYCS2|nr:selenium-binding protein SBP56-related protein [Mycolicibacterium smegmatis]ABK74613.1 56kDa selenium binding protein [Mycolicibacterium smegmatis MC2 155]AFP38518.1 56kDa selenium binding protein [Mycolicibacterium smegmatis MC2 155]AIU07302.1 selenium-binding protein [Mycolicibacterium smegmatis MC2 155]AIU13927.1 selenium-binding protein [Mycolicibacterium smegmatis]AIU20551.1 selenium-binding protein [Mycolicibacterium smegmatis]
MPTDPTFYRSPGHAVAADSEQLAYVVAFDPTGRKLDALAAVDCEPGSPDFGKVVGWTELPIAGGELHHFGWSACSSALCHDGHGGNHGALERRYLLVPGLRSSATYVLDTKPDPRHPMITHTIDATELAAKAGYSRPHTVHCGPDGIFMSALGGANGADGPGGVALIDHNTFEVIGPWEIDRGPQLFAYDVWWHRDFDTVITSEWAAPSMIEDGLDPADLLGHRFGHHVDFWSMSERKLTQRVDLGEQHQMVLELRPAHHPSHPWGFVNSVISTEDLSASVWLWHKDGEQWAVDEVINIPAEPADADELPPLLRSFAAAPPLVSDIDLSVDDRWLYVSCWGTGELKQFDVSDPFHPRETASVRLGGMVRHEPHPAAPDLALAGGPQMVEISRDGRRVYLTNSLYSAWDDTFYPDGVGAWMIKLDADVTAGGLVPDDRFFLHGEDFRGLRVHQVRLQGGDASSDSYCYPS